MAYQNKIYDLLVLLLLLESKCFAARFLPPANVTAVEGSPMDFICESDNREQIDECIFTIPGFFGKIKMFKGVINKKYEFVGEGFSKGQCGLRLLSVERENAGKVTCSLAVMYMMQEAQTDVTVLYPIEELQLKSNNINNEYKENDQMEFSCTANGGFPAPVLFLLINDHQIWNSTSKELFWKGTAKMENNGLILACCADQQHSLLPRTLTNCEHRTLTVYYSTRMENGFHEEQVPVVMGQDTIVTVKILANPWPYIFELTKNGETQDIPIMIKKINETVMECAWNISNVKLLDIYSEWRLSVINTIGNTSVHIKLSERTSNPSTITTFSPHEIRQMSYNSNRIDRTDEDVNTDLMWIWIVGGAAAILLLAALLSFLLYWICDTRHAIQAMPHMQIETKHQTFPTELSSVIGRPKKLVETEAKEQFSSSHMPLLVKKEVLQHQNDFQNGNNENIQLQDMAIGNAEKAGIKFQDGNTKIKPRDSFFMDATHHRNDDAVKDEFFGEETLPTYDSTKITKADAINMNAVLKAKDLYQSSMAFELEKEFADVAKKVVAFKNVPEDRVFAELFMFKQATTGDINVAAAGGSDSLGRQNAWQKLKGTSKEDATKKYIARAKERLQGKYQ